MHQQWLNRDDAAQVGRGLLMGAADIVPGVSGGTVALILGIYARLVAAISHVDGRLLRLVVQRQWREAVEYIDLRFLITLACGIALGIVGLASLMNHLLEHHRAPTLAAFFGLIVGSSWLVGRAVAPRNVPERRMCLAIGALGLLTGAMIAVQQPVASHSGLLYYFACGAVAICAMILPGISGSHVLLLLGAYEQITGIIRRLPRLEVTTDDLLILCVFAIGCATGLILFSKFLRWLLGRWHALTMSLLCGFMLGSLYRVWPFQRTLVSDTGDGAHDLYQPFMPERLQIDVAICALIALIATAAVLLLDHWARRMVQPHAAS